MTGELALRAQAAPFVVLVVALLVVGIAAISQRGDRLIRTAVLLVITAALPWASCLALAASTLDPVLAERMFRVGNASISLIGAGLLFLILAVAGRIERHRGLVVAAFVCASLSACLEWSTDLIVRGVQMTPLGMLYAKAGPLNGLHAGQIPLWAGVGIVIARRGARGGRDLRRRDQVKRMLIILVLAIAGTGDMLLAQGVVVIFPSAWLPGILACGLALHTIRRGDLLQGVGVDRVAVLELVAFVGAASCVMGLAWALDETALDTPLALGLLAAPLSALALAIGLGLRTSQQRTEPVEAAADRALDHFAETVQAATSDVGVVASFAELVRLHAGLDDVRLWRVRSDALVAVAPSPSPPVLDARVRAWLAANPGPLVSYEIGTLRLGGLRAPIEAFVAALDADLVLPLVDRDALVGLAAAQVRGGRVLRPGERDLLRDAAAAAARALTFAALTAEAVALEGTAREVEVAQAVQAARAGNDVCLNVGPWRVAAGYRAAARVAGDVWSWSPLPDGKLLVVIADVVGRGVPAALVSAAVAGAFEATPALLGGHVGPADVLQLLHDTVRQVGAEQRVSAFAAVLDPGGGVVRFASAGHRGGYLVRPRDGAASQVTALAARASPLGEPDLVLGTGEVPLAGDEWLVLVSDGIVEVRDEAGESLGERRILRALRDWLISAGDHAAERLLHEASAHAGGRPLDDDLVVVTVRHS